MNGEQLYFNGINGATGRPGLPPTTAEELAGRLWDARFAGADALRDLKKKLDLDLRGVNKALEVVSRLATSLTRSWSGELASPESWAAYLAQELADLLLGPKLKAPGRVQALADRLRQDPEGQLRLIFKLLLERRSQELAALLLAEPPDESAGLKESLKWTTRHLIAGLQASELDQSTARALEQGIRSPAAWQAALARALDLLPIEALKAAAGNQRFSLSALRALVDELADLPEPAGTALEPLWKALAPLTASGQEAPWPAMVAALQTGLAALSAPPWDTVLELLRDWLDRLEDVVKDLGVVPWVDPTDLKQTGWGIIFPARMPAARQQAIQQALQPLLDWRQQLIGAQAGDQPRFQIYSGGRGYRPNETARDFLGRYGADPSKPADPGATGVPYYLLLIGSPEEIPYEFQYQLDVQYAVGRLDFGDDLAAYAQYARNVVAAEQPGFTQPPSALFFGVQNPGDQATELSSRYLVQPLYDHFHAPNSPWQVDLVQGPEARKARLLAALTAGSPPALLFTASHGLEFGSDDPERQRRYQGALVCADWDGQGGTLPPAVYLAGDDVRQAGAQINLRGMIAFFFACFGAGTPRYDDYYRAEFKKQGQVLTPAAFTADLPCALLGIPNGALAVVGHVERAWGNSFLSLSAARPPAQGGGSGQYVSVFAAALDRLLAGHPIGSAMDFFNIRYAALATELVPLLDDDTTSPYRLAELWTSHNDARGYIIVGDPAVRLPAARDQGQPTGG